jgi:hypothetical protein
MCHRDTKKASYVLQTAQGATTRTRSNFFAEFSKILINPAVANWGFMWYRD